MKLVETVIETLDKVPKGASCFVERVDGARLIVKIWSRGKLLDTRALCATGLPIGEYIVVGDVVVHRHDPRTLISELAVHQHRVRMESKEFVALATRVAKQLGGRLERWENDFGMLIGYRIWPKSRAGIPGSKLARAQRDVAVESAHIFRTGGIESSPIGLAIASCDLDLCAQICTRWYADVEALIRLVDAQCSAVVLGLDHDLIDLHLARVPKQVASIERLLRRIVRDSGLECESIDDFTRDLRENHRLFLWWD